MERFNYKLLRNSFQGVSCNAQTSFVIPYNKQRMYNLYHVEFNL
jgi:hypothetical protein